MRVYGIVLAGGVGTRVGGELPKQLMHVAGRTVLEHSVAAFERCELIDEIVVMIAPGWAPQAADALGDRDAKPLLIRDGGITRSGSSELALQAIGDENSRVVLHDAARPLLSAQTIAACVRALDDYAAVGVVIPSTDTIVEVDAAGHMEHIPDRATLRRMQTPQAFHASVLADAYHRARRDPHFAATDDCGVVLRYRPDVLVGTVPGSEQNLKITTAGDIAVAEALMHQDPPGAHGGP